MYTDDQTIERKLICMESINEAYEHGIIKVIVIILSALCAVSGPYYTLIRYGDHITITSFRFPYVEPGSNTEYFMNLFVQAAFGVYGLVGGITLELGSVIVRDTWNVSVAFTRLETEKLSEDVELKRANISQKIRLSHIIQQIMEFDE